MEYKNMQPLGNLIEIKHGFAFKGKSFSTEETNLILVTPGNVKTGGGFSSNKYKYYKEDAELPTDYILSQGDLLVTMTDLSKDGDTLGYPALVPILEGKTFLHNQRLGKVIIKDENRLTKEYLYYLLCSKKYRNHVLASATGTTVKHTAPDRIKSFKCILPSLEKQRRISRILSSLDAKVELNNEMNQTIREMAKIIYKRWFVDFNFLNEEGLPYKSSDGKLFESELGLIPEGWEVKSIDQLCDITSSKRVFLKDYVSKGIPFYRSKEIIEKSKGKNISTELFITEELYGEIKEKFGVPSQGDILLTSVGTLGIPYLVEKEKFYFKDGNLTWFKNFSNEGMNLYLFYWLLSKDGKNSIDSIAIGSTQKAVTISALKNVKIPIPNSNILNSFFQLFIYKKNQIQENVKQNSVLIDIRDSLLPKLILGELRLSEDTKEVEECLLKSN